MSNWERDLRGLLSMGAGMVAADIAADALAEVERLRTERDYHQAKAEARQAAERLYVADIEALRALVRELVEALCIPCVRENAELIARARAALEGKA
jgi:hypothetical protein